MLRHRVCRAPYHAGPRWISWVEFHVKIWGDEEKTWPAQLQSWCKACQRIHLRTVQAKARGRSEPFGPRQVRMSRDEENRRRRIRYHERMQDPEWVANRRHQQRLYRLKRNRPVLLPVKPFQEWWIEFQYRTRNVTEWVEYPNRPIQSLRVYRPAKAAEACGGAWNASQFSDLSRLKGKGTVPLDVVDAILFWAGEEHMLSILYPVEEVAA